MARKLDITMGCVVVAAVLGLSYSVTTLALTEAVPIEASTYFVDFAEGEGSGVAIAPNLVLTAGHVVEKGVDEKDYKFTVSNKYHGPVSASVLWANQEYDLGLLLVDDYLPYYTSEIACKNAKLGDPITFVGYPTLGGQLKVKGPVVTKGTVSSHVQYNHIGSAEWFLTDTRSNFGGSGGPAFDSKRRLAGIFVEMFGNNYTNGSEEKLWVGSGFVGVVSGSGICKLLGRT